MNFPNYEKLNSFVETFISYNQILIFEEQLCMDNMDNIQYYTLKKISVMHVIKLDFAPVSFPPG
jgi:hypothetical protein